MYKKRVFSIISVIVVGIVLILLSGCSTPQERSGYSPIPFNAQEPADTRSFGGSF
jgi:hypothetical protein